MLDGMKKQKLVQLAQALINQENARVIMEPNKRESGYWFGGGNLVVSPNGTWVLTGRYRNFGDSRTGLEAGLRGVELAVFTSRDQGYTFTKVLSFSKQDLSYPNKPVLSIEGAALHFTSDGVELFISTEKDNVPYPENLQSFHKQGTGVWSMDRLQAQTLSALADAPLEPFLDCTDPRFLHVKDPVIYQMTNGDTLLSYCTHPYNWASSNSGYVMRRAGVPQFTKPNHVFFRRGYTWDVAISRITSWMLVPQTGVFRDEPPCVLVFYDGGECMRNLDQHQMAVKRPRGYSCEEIGGVAWSMESDVATVSRLSINLPMFVSPWGSGSSRYVDVMQTEEGLYATWEQSQPDFSQPLVMNVLSWGEVARLLA